ncbi:MAG TPA: UDP-N-acetylglucosamine 1-carboxyvinyltransferase, partial [bacterium]|nr:UDP-N-acetylglucosamine 1-carboxyvinyltransferase [bacterium]
IKPIDIITSPYPGFPTDLQAQWMAYMSVANGNSTITEKIFENRFIHIGELFRLGARIKYSGNQAFIQGVDKLKGAPVMATDLRASACLVIGGLVAEGVTEIHRVYHIDRGYERIDQKLSELGAKITRNRE